MRHRPHRAWRICRLRMLSSISQQSPIAINRGKATLTFNQRPVAINRTASALTVIVIVIVYFVPLRQGRRAKRRGWIVIVFVIVIVHVLVHQTKAVIFPILNVLTENTGLNIVFVRRENTEDRPATIPRTNMGISKLS